MPRASHATTREPHYHSASERGVADLNSVEFANDVVRLALDGADGGDAATTWRDSGFTAAPLSTVMHRRQDDEAASRIVDFPRQLPAAAPASTLHALQEWEGFVVAVREREFVARLVDLTAGSEYEDEEATFPLGDINEADIPKLTVGSIFRWVIGYQRSRAGTKRRVSEIVFRDLPAMTATDLSDGRTWADETIRSLGL